MCSGAKVDPPHPSHAVVGQCSVPLARALILSPTDLPCAGIPSPRFLLTMSGFAAASPLPWHLPCKAWQGLGVLAERACTAPQWNEIKPSEAVPPKVTEGSEGPSSTRGPADPSTFQSRDIPDPVGVSLGCCGSRERGWPQGSHKFSELGASPPTCNGHTWRHNHWGSSALH